MGALKLEGRRFKRLTVISRKGSDKHQKALWLCSCDCGNTKLLATGSLTSGNTTSCGCLHKAQVGKINITHGSSGTKLHNVWNGMHQRCSDHGQPHYRFYGGNGATVCEEWGKFEPFRDWALKNDYKEGLQIDKDILEPGNKIYSPDTCCFVDQATNKLLTDRAGRRGKYPRGVKLNGGKYVAHLSRFGKRCFLGSFDNPEEASTAYRKAKSEHVRFIATLQSDERIRDGLMRHADLIWKT